MEAKQPFTDEEYKNIYSRVPRLCVDLIIRNDSGVLMTLRDIEPYKDLWHLPGGTVLYGETIEAAAKRVARQELGIEVEVAGSAGYIEYPSEMKIKGWGWTITIEALCVIKSGEFKLDRQAREWKFFQEIPNNTVEEQKEFLEKGNF